MIERFNNETLKLVDQVCDEVAQKLEVKSATLCICTGTNADYDADNPTVFSICFETDEDDTWALLEYARDPDEDLKFLLSNFMTDPDVEWMKEGNLIESEEGPTIVFTYEEARALHNILMGDAHMVDTELLNDVSIELADFVDEHRPEDDAQMD